MYILWQCIYYHWYNKTGASAKAGSLSFHIMCGYMEWFCFKAASGLPLEIFFSKKLCNITWGLGRVRTNATPFDRRKPPDHLGTWSSLNQSRLLIGLRPQNHLGLGWTRTIATPFDRHKCHSFIWGPGWLEPLSLLLGAWSYPTMVTPSDQLSKACFCKRFLSLPLLPYFFYDYSSIFVVFPLNQQHFFTGSADGNRFICIPEKICPV